MSSSSTDTNPSPLPGLVAERLEGKRQQGGSLAVMWTYEKTRPPGLVGSGPFGSSSSSYTVVKVRKTPG
ncbi:hypothetical protein J1605_014162 [Eschrichtius robustus]|uniref:Uncharacterized protein n=1 Tax=Eschrichtius robustus TaxID=9764 RepID=A0AB34GDN0_ESCRO|nr:hypothetical protein J1605_014162 [Eschrichtius robustus]